MRNSKKEIVITIFFTMAFLLGGILRVTLGQMDFTVAISRIYFCALTLAWITTIQYRILDRRTIFCRIIQRILQKVRPRYVLSE